MIIIPCRSALSNKDLATRTNVSGSGSPAASASSHVTQYYFFAPANFTVSTFRPLCPLSQFCTEPNNHAVLLTLRIETIETAGEARACSSASSAACAARGSCPRPQHLSCQRLLYAHLILITRSTFVTRQHSLQGKRKEKCD